MPDRIFRLLESLQRLDTLLRSAQRKSAPDPHEIDRLRAFKAILRARLSRLALAG